MSYHETAKADKERTIVLWDIVCVLTCTDNFEALVSFTAVYGNVTQRGGVLRDIPSYFEGDYT